MRYNLGISLHELVSGIEAQSLECIRQSDISTLEIPSGFFYPNKEAGISLCNNVLEKDKIRVASIHASFGESFDLSASLNETRKSAVNEIVHCIQVASQIGAGIVIAHSSCEPISDDERQQRLRNTVTSLNEIKSQAEEKKVQVAVELLPRSCIGNTVEELLEIINQVNSNYVNACLDVNHLMDKYQTLPDVVHRLGDKLVNLHLSDYDGIDEKHWMPGKGVIDWAAFISALNEIDYQGPFNYETVPPGEDLEAKIAALEENYQWLAKLSS